MADSVSRRRFLEVVGVAIAGVGARRLMGQGLTPEEAKRQHMEIQPAGGLEAVDSFTPQWKMQSAAVATAGGEALSRGGADVKGWYGVTVPCTVLAGLVANGEYPDILHGDNLKSVEKSRFKPSWWYRNEFTLYPSEGQQFWLYFKGINYRANVWVNGKLVADAKTAVGTYRDLDLNITEALVAGANAVAVEVFAPEKSDLTITFVDWAPEVPDSNMGLWQDVELRRTGVVRVRYPHVLTTLSEDLSEARLTVMADVTNGTKTAATARVQATIEGRVVSQEVKLAAGETQTVTFSPEAYPVLILKGPRVWWPYQWGKPEMYTAAVEASVAGMKSDLAIVRFGVRKVTSRMVDGHLQFSVNGKDILVMGGGYAPDLLQRRVMPGRASWQEDHLRYVVGMNLNTVRLEGKLEDDAFYDLCDRYGVLVMAGWCCCSEWEKWKGWKAEQTAVAMASARYQIRRARTHPCMLAFLNGSDNAPPPEIEKQYLAIEAELKWPAPTISSAAKHKGVGGDSGVKMEGPYKWEPPIYWLTDKTKGGAYGFNTEVGPGAVPPPLESIQAMLPADKLWPMNDGWDFHAGGGTFGKFADFTDALDARYGKSTGVADFSWKAQAQAHETIRAMFEGFRRNKFHSAAGEIQWMLNNAWPSLIWHLYDYYWRPGAAYFATRSACEPVHVLYSYDDQSVVVANDTLAGKEGLVVSAAVYGLDGKVKHEQQATVNVGANATTAAFTLPKLADLSTTYFLRLTLKDTGGSVVSVNSYALSTKADVLDEHAENKDDWAFTPCKSYADFSGLSTLPAVTLNVKQVGTRVLAEPGESVVAATVRNASAEGIAFMVRLKLVGKNGDEVLPVRWQDNYFMLLPGEERVVEARYRVDDAPQLMPQVVGQCFNNNRV